MDPEIIKAGDDAGNRMVVKYRFPDGVVVHGIGVPQAWQSTLGPTWSYVVEGDKLTLVDTGCNGSLRDLEEGLDILNSVVGLYALADDAPRDSVGAEKVVLRIGDDQGGIRRVNCHAGIRQLCQSGGSRRKRKGDGGHDQDRGS